MHTSQCLNERCHKIFNEAKTAEMCSTVVFLVTPIPQQDFEPFSSHEASEHLRETFGRTPGISKPVVSGNIMKKAPEGTADTIDASGLQYRSTQPGQWFPST